MSIEEQKEELKKFLNTKKSLGFFNEKYFQDNYLELYNDFLQWQFLSDFTFIQKIFHYLNNDKNFNLGRCIICGNRCTFMSYARGYHTHCSHQCVYADPNTIKNIKKTKELRYGNANYNNADKFKQTCLEKYGSNSYLGTKDCLEKTKETNKRKYGVEWLAQNKEIHEKQISTFKQRYLNEIKKDYPEIISIEKDNIFLCKCNNENCNLCSEKQYRISGQIFYLRKRKFKTDTCTIKNPIETGKTSIEEKQLLKYIQSIYKGKIIENDRSVLDKKELDVYLPEKKIAFEFNGLYWHSELCMDKNYHKDKSLKCLEKGVQLIHIWEDDWLYKNDIVKDLIRTKLGLNENRVYARKCIIKEVDSKTSSEFLNQYHLQGNVNAKIRLGLFFNDELVEIITFGKLRKAMNSKSESNDEYELYRLCTKSGCSVVGGFSKLLTYFKKNYNPSKIITYASLDISKGNVYRNIGFKEICLTTPGYFWVVDNIRKHRFNFTKQKLISEGYDKNKTEDEIMHERRCFKIFDSGNYKFEM